MYMFVRLVMIIKYADHQSIHHRGISSLSLAEPFNSIVQHIPVNMSYLVSLI